MSKIVSPPWMVGPAPRLHRFRAAGGAASPLLQVQMNLTIINQTKQRKYHNCSRVRHTVPTLYQFMFVSILFYLVIKVIINISVSLSGHFPPESTSTTSHRGLFEVVQDGRFDLAVCGAFVNLSHCICNENHQKY